jgi:hypothetical protein
MILISSWSQFGSVCSIWVFVSGTVVCCCSVSPTGMVTVPVRPVASSFGPVPVIWDNLSLPCKESVTDRAHDG